MPDTKKRNATELTYTAAVKKLTVLTCDRKVRIDTARAAAEQKVMESYRAKFAAVLARVPEKVRAAVAEEAGVEMPDLNATMDALAAEGPPSDPDAIPERLLSELSPERKKIAGMK